MANYIPRRQNNVSNQPRGEPLCPRCGSTNLIYKNVFDYYKCNDCGITFITPVYNYNSGGLDTAKDIASKIFGEGRSVPPQQVAIEEPVEEEVPEPQPRRKPARLAETRERQRQRSPMTQAWLAFALIICVVIIICLVVWILFGDRLGDILMGATGVIL